MEFLYALQKSCFVNTWGTEYAFRFFDFCALLLLSIPMTYYNMKSYSEKVFHCTRKSSVGEFRKFFETTTHVQEPYSVSLVISFS